MRSVMDATELAPRLWRWTAHHDEWGHEVGSVSYEADDAVVLFNPLVPRDAAERFWRALDRDVARTRAPVHVLVTVFWHARSAREVVARYDARLWANQRARAPIARRAGEPTDLFRPGDELPGGVQEFDAGRRGEVVFFVPEQRPLIVGDVLLGSPLRLCPPSWLPKAQTPAGLAQTLRPVLELPVERVLVSHGEPVLADAHAQLGAALASAQAHSSSATER
jgi:glyoxylase-like metal-dependent hydrolase (beta-lactamase superfamily II)